MANVWVARPRDDPGSERLVVLKTILPKFAADARFQEMFLREGAIAARISHRNVARIFDLGETQGVLYIAMEYVDGDALSRLDRACQKLHVSIPPRVGLRILADVCAGLQHAHELRDGTGRLLNVVHCDISPPNILISTQGVSKLIDFGIAETHLRANQENEPGVVKGKAHYMAPEQALGRPVDRRADIWAVGAILYYLLSGRTPYDEKTDTATLLKLTSGKPPAPLPETVHPAIASIVERALRYEPDDRYATAAEMQAAIEGAMREARLSASAGDVAAFASPHLSERAESRRRAIEEALLSAAERERAGRKSAPAVEAPRSVPRLLASRRMKLAAVTVLALGVSAALSWWLVMSHGP
jgi:serine/threonine-protein kinase